MDLPLTTTALFGRDDELAQISEHLESPECRLITFVGPGGIGKTRLSIEAARRYAEKSGHRAVFVDLQSVDSPELVITALAEALEVSVGDHESAVQQVAQYLSTKQTLLLFDNFEQVVESADSLGELIEQSPQTKLLVTSRTPLRLTQEWLFRVNGLPIPQANRPRSSNGVASAQLFIDRARRMRPDFQVDNELAAIERICQITEGMPLALELAASWTRMLSCAEIATEIENNRQFLATDLRDIPERHRSIQAVFDQVLRILDEEERKVFGRLSIFKGGFSREAAQKVAGASLPVLTSLLDKSLLRRTQDDRYRIHELVRQFGHDQLARSEEDFDAARIEHSRYFLEFLAERNVDLNFSRQAGAIAEIEPDLENIRAAWLFAANRSIDELIAKATLPLSVFLQCQGRFLLGGELFSAAIDSYRPSDRHMNGSELMADLLMWHGWFNLRQGHIDAGEAAFRECFEIQTRLGPAPPTGFATDGEIGLTYVASTRGEIDTARKHTRSTMDRAVANQHVQHLIMTNQLLGHLAMRSGELDIAAEHARNGLEKCQEMGEQWFSSYCHDILGEIAVIRGQHDEATMHFELGLKIRESFGDKAGIGVAHAYLGELSMLSNANGKARFHFGESAEAHLQVGDRGGVTRVRSGLGLLDVIEGNSSSASEILGEVLDNAVQMQYLGVILDALSGIGQMALNSGLRPEGGRLLAYVSLHELTEPRTHAQLQRVLDNDSSAYEPSDSGNDLDDLMRLAREVVTRVGALPSAKQPEPAISPSQNGSSLPEPLTDRELEVLGLIAAGQSNQQIADDPILSLGTVKWHSNQIYMKLGVHNRTSAVAKASELGVLSPGD